jgi:hypothetical protein
MMIWLVVITMINAAISAAYYLRIVGTMFLARAHRSERRRRSTGRRATTLADAGRPLPLFIAVGISTFGTLLFGTLPPATEVLLVKAETGSNLEDRTMTGFTAEDNEARATAPLMPPSSLRRAVRRAFDHHRARSRSLDRPDTHTSASVAWFNMSRAEPSRSVNVGLNNSS